MFKPIRVLLVEKEIFSMEKMKIALQQMNFIVSGMARNEDEVFEVLEKSTTDLIIIDPLLKGENGESSLAVEINKRYTLPLIFHGNVKHKVQIKSDCTSKLSVDYNNMDLFTCINRLMIKSESLAKKTNNRTSERPKVKESNLKFDDFIFVRDKDCYSRIRIMDILYIASEQKYTKVMLKNKRYILRQSLTDFLKQLPGNYFIQVHRSYAVNIKEVEKIGKSFLMIKDTEIPISSARKEKVIEQFTLI